MATKSYLGLRGHSLHIATVVLIVLPSFILFGMAGGVMGGIAGLPSFIQQFPSAYDVTSGTPAQNSHIASVKGIVTGCYDLGAVVGSMMCIAYSDKIGRLRTLAVGLLVSIVGFTVEASSFSVGQFVVGRLLVGVAVGTISAVVPVWQSECAATAHRGTLVIVEGLSISAGITLSEWVDLGFSFITSESKSYLQWRIPLIVPVIFALFVLPLLFFMPESPRWLVKMGRVDEARQVLEAFAGDDEVDGTSPSVDEILRGIEASLTLTQGSLKDVFHNGEERVFHRAALACTVQVFQQFCGISGVIFYTSTVFERLGFAGVNVHYMSCGLTSFQTLASIVPIFLIERLGRRTLLMSAGIGLSLSCAVVAGTGDLTGNGKIAAVVAFFVYQFFYPFGFLGQTFLYASEVSPLHYRVPITATANATQWLCQFIVAQITPVGTAGIGNKFYIVFAVLNASFVPIVYFFFPETKGRSLEDIDIIFRHTNSIFDAVSVAKNMTQEQARQEEEIMAVVGGAKRLEAGEVGEVGEVEAAETVA